LRDEFFDCFGGPACTVVPPCSARFMPGLLANSWSLLTIFQKQLHLESQRYIRENL
jgi:hypothetical protein